MKNVDIPGFPIIDDLVATLSDLVIDFFEHALCKFRINFHLELWSRCPVTRTFHGKCGSTLTSTIVVVNVVQSTDTCRVAAFGKEIALNDKFTRGALDYVGVADKKSSFDFNSQIDLAFVASFGGFRAVLSRLVNHPKNLCRTRLHSGPKGGISLVSDRPKED